MNSAMDGKLRNMTSLYLRHDGKLLFLYRIGSRVIADSYVGAAGGHFEKEELNDAKACVLRELQEEVGLTENDLEHLSLRYVTLRLKNGEIRQNYYFFADWKPSERELCSREGTLQWTPEAEVPALEMPFTAKYVLEHYMNTGKHTESLYFGVATETGVQFTEAAEF